VTNSILLQRFIRRHIIIQRFIRSDVIASILFSFLARKDPFFVMIIVLYKLTYLNLIIKNKENKIYVADFIDFLYTIYTFLFFVNIVTYCPLFN